jgi:CubicO group peptidase (beta-lactamase class C family)
VFRQGPGRGWTLPARRRIRLLFASTAASLLIIPACSSSGSEPTTETGNRASEFSAALQRVLDEFRRSNDLPGISAAVIAPGVGLWSGESGVADTKTGEPLRPDALFPIGDVSKNLTAALVLKLAEDRVLALDDAVADYVSGVPNGSKITIRQLLGLTSGLGPLKQAFWRALQEEPSRRWTPKETLGYMAAPYASPGEGFRYSDVNFNEGYRHGDPNYVVAGAVIEAATSSTVAEELERRLLGPLGLSKEIFVQGEECVPREIAHGYQDLSPGSDVFAGDGELDDTLGLETGWQPESGSTCSYLVPTPAFATAIFTDGALVASAPGLARWAKALFSGQAVSRASLEAMTVFHPISFPQGGHRDYGLGVAEYVMRGVVWEHEGAFPGYSSYMGYLPEEGVSVVALTNAVFSMRPLADALLGALFDHRSQR